MKQRQIKFRAWDGDSMQDTFSVQSSGDGILYSGCIMPNWIPMQFTGLKDKEKTDCYEGDILENPYGKRGFVVFYDGCFRLQTHKGETSSHYITMNPGYMENKKIIGNIYEHFELITTKKIAP